MFHINLSTTLNNDNLLKTSMFTFKKGVLLPEEKLTAKSPIVVAPLPDKVVIPLQQHIGAPCEPLVKVGERVRIYQKIADTKIPNSAPIHASASGTVVDIADFPSPLGVDAKSIVIERNGDKEPDLRKKDVESYSSKRLLELVRESGIVGLGGAAFPTHLKLQPQKPVDTIILNGSECEPYLTSDHRLMLEHAQDIIMGLRVEMKILGVQKAYIGIEDNKRDAVLSLQKFVENDKTIKVVELKTKYPEGAEKILIKAILNRECPHSSLPSEVGVVVSNVATAKAIYDAVYYERPLIERVVTVTGAVKKPQNLLVRIGTPLKILLDFCKSSEPQKIVVGGPMMGVAQYTDQVPVTKATTGIVVFDKPVEERPMHCIRCGRCVDACPYNLVPTTIAKASEKGKFQLAELYHAMECMECGCCSYVCPSNIPLVQHIRVAKAEIMKGKKK
jgi:electron transport complex protein RnfC